MIEVVSENIKESVIKCFEESQESIEIVSPFLSMKTADMLCDKVHDNPDLSCIVVTRCYMRDFINGANNIGAIKKMIESGITVYALEGLHAKLYLFDQEQVILGSANFTIGGLVKNVELSILTDEDTVIDAASSFLDQIINHCDTHNGIIDMSLIQVMEEDYQKAYADKQIDFHNNSLKMYGAEHLPTGQIKLNGKDWKDNDSLITDWDPVYEMFVDGDAKRTQYAHNIWAKFEGRADNRQDKDEKPTLAKVMIDDHEAYIINFRNRPKSIADGDIIYIVSLTKDNDNKNATRIVGRGKAKVYQNKNSVKSEWIKEYPWMSYYHYFCEIIDVELINARRVDCLPLSQVYDVLDKKTYVSTYGKDYVENMSKCQCRRPYLQMTFDAQDYIDKELDKLADKYGLIEDIETRAK